MGVGLGFDFSSLQDLGLSLFQGYLSARPAFESLPPILFDMDSISPAKNKTYQAGL
jgi:hypothetical protein